MIKIDENPHQFSYEIETWYVTSYMLLTGSVAFVASVASDEVLKIRNIICCVRQSNIYTRAHVLIRTILQRFSTIPTHSPCWEK